MIPCSRCGHEVDDDGSEIVAWLPDRDDEADYLLCSLCREEVLAGLIPVNWSVPLEHLCITGMICKGPREDCCIDQWEQAG